MNYIRLTKINKDIDEISCMDAFARKHYIASQ